MTEHAYWRLYPVGPLGSLVRAVSSAVSSVPIIAMLMILPFLAARYVAEKGAFGVNTTGLAWAAWAELALGFATLAFTVGAFAVSLLSLVRTVAAIGGLRRAIRHGASRTEVPHPEQWTRSTEWGGTSMVISSLLTTAVLAFPGVLTAPVRAWVEALPGVASPAVVTLPVAMVVVVVIFRAWRKGPVREIEGWWSEQQRDAAVALARDRVPRPPVNAAGDPKNPAQTQRSPLDSLGDRVNTAGIVLMAVAVLDAAITLPVGTELIGYGFASSPVQVLVLLSSVLLIAIAIALYVLGGVLQNAGQAAELRTLLAAAESRSPAVPPLGVLSRHWRPMNAPWVDFLGLVGALVLLLALPAALLPSSAAAAAVGVVGVLLAVVLLVAAVAVDVGAEARTRDRRNLVLRRWPTPNPAELTDVEDRVDDAVQADVERYGQRPGAPPSRPAASAGPTASHAGPTGGSGQAPGSPPGPPAPGPYAVPAPGPYAPPAGGPHPAPGGSPYPPPPGLTPTGAPPPVPTQPPGARRAWGLPKKLRHRGLGGLYR